MTATDPAQTLRERFGAAPRTAVVLGSGLGGLVDHLEGGDAAPYDALGWPQTTVPGHEGAVHVGSLGGERVALLAGRLHLYEGHEPQSAVHWVGAMSRWGVERLVLTSAVGSLRADWVPGTLVCLTDHINLMGKNPLVGLAGHGPERFVDMSDAYGAPARAVALDVAAGLQTELRTGVYAAVLGPSFETSAEVRMLGSLGADVVGMSVVPEVIAARFHGLDVLAFAVMANFGTGLTDAPTSHDGVTKVVAEAGSRLVPVVLGTLAAW